MTNPWSIYFRKKLAEPITRADLVEKEAVLGDLSGFGCSTGLVKLVFI